jgi:hypothetical protein
MPHATPTNKVTMSHARAAIGAWRRSAYQPAKKQKAADACPEGKQPPGPPSRRVKSQCETCCANPPPNSASDHGQLVQLVRFSSGIRIAHASVAANHQMRCRLPTVGANGKGRHTKNSIRANTDHAAMRTPSCITCTISQWSRQANPAALPKWRDSGRSSPATSQANKASSAAKIGTASLAAV